MNNNIRKTKKKLTIIFSIIVFIIILSLGTLFFSFKYFKEIRIAKNEFSILVNDLEKGNISIDQIMNFGEKFDKDLFNNKRSKRPEVSKTGQEYRFRGFINYILINPESTIVSSNIKDDIDAEFMLNINERDEFFTMKQSNGFLIKKFLLDDNRGTFIIFKEIGYDFGNYMIDVFGFLFINLLFSLILYFIGSKFVNKAFIPVEENMQDMKNFIHNAGHELKTPISVIDSNIQMMDDTKSYDKEMTKELKVELMRLNSIIDGLIKLSDIDGLKDMTHNTLKDIIDEIVNKFKGKIEEKEIKIKLNIGENINIKANKDYFYMFLSNIIANAIKYNHQKGSIDISYNNGKLIIKDTGLGIHKKDLDKIFDRFFKADTSRNSEGFGIGLSLVKKIGDIYKWNIEVQSTEGKGSTFIIKF